MLSVLSCRCDVDLQHVKKVLGGQATLGLQGNLRFRSFLLKSAGKLYAVIRMPSCVFNTSAGVMRNVPSCQEPASNIT